MMGRAAPVSTVPTPVVQGPGVTVENIGRLFPTVIPDCETIIWQALNDATKASVPFPEDVEGQGIFLPAAFSTPPGLALIPGMDETYPPVGGNEIVPIPIVRGWPTLPGVLPKIGVATTIENEDGTERLGQGGFAGDLDALDEEGKVIATCAYYAEPLYSTVIVELIHENRDERDRLHRHLRARLYPLRHQVPETYGTVKELSVQSEKQELPVDEQPYTIYASVFTIEMWSEALIPTPILTGTDAGTVGKVTIEVKPEV